MHAEQTIGEDLAAKVAFPEAFDRFSLGVQEILDMPADRVELPQKFLQQNDGRPSQRARTSNLPP